MAEYISEAEVLQRALDTYGSALQIVVMMEEMSELQKELCKYLRGKYSPASIAEEIAARRHQHRCEVLTLERVRANAIQASALNVNESDVIFHSIMVHYENDLPVQIEDRCVNADIAVDYLTQDYSQTTPHAYLSRIAPLTEGEHIVEAVRATAQECAWLTIKEHEPCLLIRRTTWSASRIVSRARLLFPGSRYRLQGRFIS